MDPVNPNPQEPTPTQSPAEDLSNVALHKKAGGDWRKANESYFNAVQELGKTHQDLQAKSARLEQLEAMVGAVLGGAAPSVNQSPFAELEQLGVNSQAIEAALEAKANALVENKLGTLFSPILQQIEAEETLAREIKNFDQHKIDAREFMKENPEVAEVFNAVRASNPVAAWKYAIKESLIAKQAEGNPRRLPVGLPGGRAPDARGTDYSTPDQRSRENAAADFLHQTGDPNPYLRERFKGTSVEAAVRDAMRHFGFNDRE